ncbi:RsmD family RNA methyltransferase [Leucobacter weissii]|uniref:RsmD family RNA methyltransferase n=1 Tax=Leucobacter weissii TaxID=1983706 RepID=A0A939S9M9_9MICO|nr:RsmD family RNA methyltransferase [Leucobacter weissii]MBO1901092.1 RsmD family RNA methyltransferase [Leucobacter weissii]
MTRIISGAAGSLRLEVPKSGTRPTSDRVREAVFSALDSWDALQGARVLDLYAGSGALGLEAASRGAGSVTLVERHPQAAQVAQRNARTVAGAFGEGTGPRIDVRRQSVRGFLEAADPAADSQPGYGIALIDPPYDLGESELSENLAALVPLLAEGAIVMVERSTRSPEPVWPSALEPLRGKRYGETALWWSELA